MALTVNYDAVWNGFGRFRKLFTTKSNSIALLVFGAFMLVGSRRPFFRRPATFIRGGRLSTPAGDIYAIITR